MKKSTLIKLVKEELTKSKVLKESNLAAGINSLIADGQNYREFAKAVAQVLEDAYGTHNYQPFMEALHSELGLKEGSAMNEEETQDTYIVTYEIGVKGEDDDVRVQASSEEEAIEKVKSGEAKLPYGQKLSALARNFHARKLEK